MAILSCTLPPIESNASNENTVPHLLLAPPDGQGVLRSLAEEGPRVFVAEDDPDFLPALGELLTAEGFRPELFPTALRLLEALAGELPSLIVTDLVMPGMSGVQLFRALRADERWRHIPLIVMTGSNDTALPLRIDAPIVYKPDTDALLAVMQTLVI